MAKGQRTLLGLKRWNLIAIASLVALVLTGVGVARLMIPTQAQNEESSPSEPSSLPQRVAVVALGRLEPQGEVIRVSGPSGDRIGRLQVQRGDWVEAGAVLAYLESYEERLAERNLAASQLAEAEAKFQAETTYRQAQIQEAETRIQQVDQPKTFEVEAQEATVRQLEAELSLANADLNRSQSLYQEGAISRQELDQQMTEVRQIQERLNNARATLIRLEASWTTDRSNAQAQLQSAEANLTLSQVATAVESARQNLKLAESRLERTMIRAPQTGRVLQILTYAGETVGENGILELGNTQQMYVVAEVHETDVGRVEVGQTATITSRNGAFAGSLTGTVAEIGWQIFKNNVLDDDPAANADARVVEVKVRLEDSEPVKGLTNLQVDVRIDAS